MDARLARIALATLAISLTAPAAAKDTYRWVDENGKVHFSESLPPEYADKPHQKINDAGIVIEEVTDPVAAARAQAQPNKKAEPEPIYTPEEIRDQSDRLLLLKYRSEQEIFDAMEVEIANLGYDRRLIQQTRDSTERAMIQQIRQAAALQRAGKDVPEEKRRQISELRRQLEGGNADLGALTSREAGIRESFAAQLERYRSLTAEKDTPAEDAPEAASGDTG
jgi:hypothetical protein